MFSFRNQDLVLKRELLNSLQCIWGVGWHKSRYIAIRIGFGYPFFINHLNFYFFSIITFMLKRLVLTRSRCERVIFGNIKRCISIGCVKGMKFSRSLPVNGQRTKSNGRTSKQRRGFYL